MRKWSGLRYLTTIFGYAGAIVHESHHLTLPKEQPKQSQKRKHANNICLPNSIAT